MPGWANPTSVADPEAGWSDDAFAIDGNPVTVAKADAINKPLTGQYSGGFADCTHIRVQAAMLISTTPVTWGGVPMVVQAEWDSEWHDVWTGTSENGAEGTWTYITIDDLAAHNVTEMGVKFTNRGPYGVAFLCEMGFGRVPKENFSVALGWGVTPKDGAIKISKRSSMWTPLFAYADNQYLYWDDSSPPTTLRKSVETAEDVEWYAEGENEWQSDTTYHWRVDATNDVTDDVSGVELTKGTELSFTTDPACHKIYRGQDGDIDYSQLQAEMELDDSQVSIPAQVLPPNTIWHYIRREASHCGLESDDSPVCKVVIDSAGEMVGSTPNQPLLLTIEPLAGAKFRLRWRYTPVYEEVPPTGFKIYMAAGGEEFDFDSPIATVPYGLGGFGEFTWTSDELTNDVTYRFCIRSYRSDGGESQNTDYVAAVADSQGPDAITGLRTSWEET